MDVTSSLGNIRKNLTFESVDHEKWFDLLAPFFARLMASGGNSPEQQRQDLTFLCSQILPSFGPHPPRHHCLNSLTGLPTDSSVNYVQHGRRPMIRMSFEAQTADSATELDPYNQKPAEDFLARLSKADFSGFDTQLSSHFISELTLDEFDKSKLSILEVMNSIVPQRSLGDILKVASSPDTHFLRTQIMIAVDFNGDNTVIKSYVLPALKAKACGLSVGQLLLDSVQKVQSQMDCLAAFTMAHEFLTETNGFSNINGFSWDYLVPAQSRLKLYSTTNAPTWPQIEALWTLNNRAHRPTNSIALRYLRKLWNLLGMVDGGPIEPHVPVSSIIHNFEMKPGNPVPETKIYFSMQGKNVLQLVAAISWFLDHIGLKELGAGYSATVQSYFPDCDFTKAIHFVDYVSFAYNEKTGVYMSVYYHPSVVLSMEPFNIGA
ncbi:hypothetical protein FE257_006467 [Aspergillus nanangensis]|uniref:Aromatic prenyltransferase n=1 Tax=Aspergillus nanangensis TaxID=2582783 RepID=A0AAD4GZ43_ASPNN|nr:hypothetical protein FE257_006467 [Aspergillus nanangensis]